MTNIREVLRPFAEDAANYEGEHGTWRDDEPTDFKFKVGDLRRAREAYEALPKEGAGKPTVEEVATIIRPMAFDKSQSAYERLEQTRNFARRQAERILCLFQPTPPQSPGEVIERAKISNAAHSALLAFRHGDKAHLTAEHAMEILGGGSFSIVAGQFLIFIKNRSQS